MFGGSLHDLTEASVLCIDINATEAELLTDLPHVGPARAEAIEEGRPWQSLEDLSRIRGISPGRVDEIQASGLLCD
ncbi:helix-hairpin-helix domain-containing protein [Halomonas kenyensis]|uniref:Helix-hairpin-helix domain-containing protein n=1 Tax=Billgrantia kenyensis TaxID=321266 RepID=A0A7W0AG36_9GAMM|nr:helix-hairpin-helix domain-containing protein [Halomonas kenyensis]MCG6663891.1 hypothetical protein [Halomonas kenyensis]